MRTCRMQKTCICIRIGMNLNFTSMYNPHTKKSLQLLCKLTSTYLWLFLYSTLLVRLSLYATFSWELSVADCCLFPLIEQDPAAGCAEFCLSSRQIRRMSRAISVISTMSVCFTIENIKELLYTVLGTVYLQRGVSCQGAILQSGKWQVFTVAAIFLKIEHELRKLGVSQSVLPNLSRPEPEPKCQNL